MAVTKQQYWAIKERMTPQEGKLVDYYELQWHLRHRVPTVSEVAQYLKISQTTVNYYLQRRCVVKALDKRGIVNWRQHTQTELTGEQVAVAITISNFADVRSNTEKLDQMGVAPATYYAWLKDPQFKTLVQNLADENLGNIRPTAIGELTKKINAGDWQAVKFYLETTGELQNDNEPQSEQMLKMIIEIIQKHVKDPQVMTAIAADILAASANRNLEAVTPAAITGELVEEEIDYELEKAKEMLGVR